MAYPNIATINLTLLTSAASSATFGTAMFITAHRNYTERVREYNSAADVLADGFSETSAAYKAAQAYFSPTPKPASLKIGRQAASVSLNFAAEVAEDEIFGLNIGVNTNTKNLVSYTALVGEVEEDVVDELVALINTQYSGLITATKVGSGAAASMTLVAATPSVNFSLGELVNLESALTPTETIVAAKTAITDVDPDYAFTTSEYRDSTNVLALANAVEAEERMYFVALGEAESLNVLDDTPTDVAGMLAVENLERTAVLFHHTAPTQYPELSYIGRFSTYEPGTIDWYAKNIGVSISLDPVTGTRLSSTQQNNLIARKASAIVLEGGLPIIKMGYVLTGEKIDNIRFRDFYAARLREAYQTWRINRKKIPYDQIGVDSAEGVFRSVSERYVSTPQRPHAIQRYVTNFPLRDTISFSDISNGILRAEATVYLTGSIFTVVLDGVLTYDAEF